MRSSLRSWRARARIVQGLPWSDRALLAETYVALGVARLMVLTLPFRWIAARLDAPASGGGEWDGAPETTDRIARALAVVSRRTPWRSNCLARALACRMMLARRGVSSTLVLGVDKQGDRMEAHAWLECGGRILTGGEERDRFTIITTFGIDR